MNIFKRLHYIRKAKDPHFLFIPKKKYFRYRLIIKLFLKLNPNYIEVELFRKDYKLHGDIVVIGLRYYGKNVKRRTNGYAKDFVRNNPDAICIYCETDLHEGNATSEHLHAISHGGNNCKVNLIVCCKDCNSERGNEDFYTYLKAKNDKYKKIKYPFI